MTCPTQTQQGVALIEALMASAVLGIGLMGATQLSLKTLNTAHTSGQHTVAQHLAQEAMDCLRHQTQTGMGTCPPQSILYVQGVRYQRAARSTPRGDGSLHDLHVRVQWANNDNGIEWHSSASTLP